MLMLSCSWVVLYACVVSITLTHSFQPAPITNAKYNDNHLVLRRQDCTKLSVTTSTDEVSSTANVDEGAEVNGNNSLQNSRRVALLVCPAQFCVPDDYDVLFENLSKEGLLDEGVEIGTCRVAPLPRTEWIKVARNLPTPEFLEARLPVHSTLEWYFDAMENAINEIFAIEGPDVNICIVGHSIGGWVARAFLGGLSR